MEVTQLVSVPQYNQLHTWLKQQQKTESRTVSSGTLGIIKPNGSSDLLP